MLPGRPGRPEPGQSRCAGPGRAVSSVKVPNPDMPSVAMARRANTLIRPLLSSPLHRVLSGRLMLLTYTGRKSGRQFTVPIGYFDWDPGTVLSMSSHLIWIVNLRGGSAVRLRIRGREYGATPKVIEDDADVAAVLGDFVDRKGPKAATVLRLGLPGDRRPTDDELQRAGSMTRLVLFQLDD
jgi:F420H(2)-dependent quinone reductase